MCSLDCSLDFVNTHFININTVITLHKHACKSHTGEGAKWENKHIWYKLYFWSQEYRWKRINLHCLKYMDTQTKYMDTQMLHL